MTTTPTNTRSQGGAIWVIPQTRQFSWEPQDERYWTRIVIAAAPASAQEAPAGWQVRAIVREGGPGKWRHADECDLDAYRNGPDMWELRPVFASPSAAVQQGETAGAMLQGVHDLLSEAYEHWDADREFKVGKILLALIGHNKGYDKRSDAFRAALASAQPKTGERSE